MEQLIEQLKKTVALAQQELDAAREKNREANERSAKNRYLQNQLATQQAELDEREAALEGKEAPQEALAKAGALNSETKTQSKQLSDERVTFEKEKSDWRTQQAKERRDLKEKQDHCDRLREDFKARQLELDEREKNMRDKIIEELKSKI